MYNFLQGSCRKKHKSYPLNFSGSSNGSYETGSFGNTEGFKYRGAPEVHVFAAVHAVPEEPSTNLMEPTGSERQCRHTCGSDVKDLWPAVCGGDQGGFHGHEQERSGAEAVSHQLRTQR